MADCLTTTKQTDDKKCPHCGQMMPGVLSVDLATNTATANGRTIALGALQAEILEAICEVHPRPARLDYIESRVNGALPEETSRNCIQATICRGIRPKLAALGMAIVTIPGAYTLVGRRPSDTALFTDEDATIVRRAIQVLLKGRRML